MSSDSPPRPLSARCIKRLVGLLVSTGLFVACGAEGPAWVDLAALPAEDVRFEHGLGGRVDFGELDGRSIRLSTEDGESWLELSLAHGDWSATAHAGAWLTPVPLVFPSVTPPPSSAEHMTERLQARDRHFQPAQLDPDAGFVVDTDVFLSLWKKLQLRLAPGVKPPPEARFAWRVTHGVRAQERFLIRGRRISGDGFAVPSGTRCELVTDVPPRSRLLFATASESLLGDIEGAHEQRFRILLDARVVFEHTQTDSEVGTVVWHEVPLPADGVTAAHLTFEVDGALAYSSFLAPTIGPAESGNYPERPWGERRPDLVLFLADTLRADCLSVYDSSSEPFRPPGLDLTPALDGFTAQSRTFTNTRSVSTWTLPSVSSMLTGLFPHQTGIVDAGTALPEGASTLAERLQRVGYRTAAVTEGGFVSAQHGFARGFGSFCEGSENLDQTLQWAREAIEADDGRPLFLVVHTFHTHTPYDISAGTRARFGAALGLAPEDTYERLWQAADEWKRNEEVVAKVRGLYLGQVVDLDERFGVFHSFLGDRGVLENGYLLFTSDHGESFGEHGEFWHTGAPHEELVRVPMILQGPGISPGIDPSSASLIDIAPTLLVLAGLPSPAEYPGVSLLTLEAGRPAFSFECAAPGSVSQVAVVERFRKVIGTTLEGIVNHEVRAAYDLEADPAERENLVSEEVLWTRELFEEHADSMTLFIQPRFLTKEVPMDSLRRAELKALGYIDG